MLDAIADAFVVIDTEFRSTYLNEHAAELLGKPIKSLVGRPLWDTIAGPDDAEFRRLFHDAMTARRPTEFETYSSPLKRWLSVRAVPSDDGGLVVFFKDVTRGRRVRDASEFLIDASRVLSSSLDYETTLQNLASAAVPRIADWCSIDMLQTPGDRSWPPTVRRVALTHENRNGSLVERSVSLCAPTGIRRAAWPACCASECLNTRPTSPTSFSAQRRRAMNTSRCCARSTYRPSSSFP